MDPHPALTWRTLAVEWDMPVVVAVLLGAAAILYAAGLFRAGGWRRRDTFWFYLGLVVCAITAGGGVNAYSTTLFSVHMAQHLLLIMIVPALLLLGRPLELLRRTSGGPWRAALGRIARGRSVRVLTHPAFAFVYYAAVVTGTHLTPFQQSAATQPWLHGLEELLYLSSGYLFLFPVLAAEPCARRLGYLLRLVVLLAGMVVDTVVGIALLMTPKAPFPAYADPSRGWGPDATTDLHWGGAMMWVGGDLLMAVLAIIVITAWVSSSGGEADLGSWLESARRSALNVDRDGENVNIDEDEEALRAYNAMLARLSASERDPGTP